MDWKIKKFATSTMKTNLTNMYLTKEFIYIYT